MTKNNNNPTFTPTFRKYANMTDSEKAAFRQGAATVDNSVQVRLGLKKPRDQKATTPPTPLKNSAAPKDDFYKRYQQIKAKNKDAILFFRLGDFYEVLGADAQVVSKALGLVLTTRSIGNERIPMCGVPFHSLDNYISKLIQNGYKVAIAN